MPTQSLHLPKIRLVANLAQFVPPQAKVLGQTNIEISGLCQDSRLIRPGEVFFALSQDRRFVEQALYGGAVAVVSQEPAFAQAQAWLQVADVAQAMGEMSSAFLGYPSHKLKVVAVTGTNGKTSTATMLYQLAQALGEKSGLISTIENRIGNTVLPATHTTPNSLNLHQLMAQMVDSGCLYCFMEASSHGLHQKRLAGVKLTGGIFTNITQDHLDYHITFDNYIRAKKLLFDALPSSAFALVNKDDRRWAVMLQNCAARAKTFALYSQADYQAKILENSISGLMLKIQGQEFYSQLIGEFNAYNLLCVYGAAQELGFDSLDTLEYLSLVAPVPGRFERLISPNQVLAVVDYAHTPDALENVLKTLVQINKGGKILAVIGCGGDRDKTKRPKMAAIAAKYANFIILTSDNPRSEDPIQIIEEMKMGFALGFKSFVDILDREQAIETALQMAAPGDMVLIAGKGHETYQEIRGIKYPFDDRIVVKKYFNKPKN